jgi:hypothetical protein
LAAEGGDKLLVLRLGALHRAAVNARDVALVLRLCRRRHRAGELVHAFDGLVARDDCELVLRDLYTRHTV